MEVMEQRVQPAAPAVQSGEVEVMEQRVQLAAPAVQSGEVEALVPRLLLQRTVTGATERWRP